MRGCGPWIGRRGSRDRCLRASVRAVSLLALLPSSLLGSAMWRPVAEALNDLGRPATAVDLEGPPPSSSAEALGEFLRALPRDEDLVLVPHSNAGLYVPAISAQRAVSAVVFVDAGLPPVDGTDAPVVPGELGELLEATADADRMVPPWSEWWDPEDVARLFPDARTRARVARQQRRLPLSYFRDSVPAPGGWDRRPCAYLAFGETYQAETRTARDRGWPVRVLDGDHLETTVHPRAVAEAILGLLEESSKRAGEGQVGPAAGTGPGGQG